MSTRLMPLHHKNYHFVIRWSMISTILAIGAFFLVFPKFINSININEFDLVKEETIIVIPPTVQDPPKLLAPVLPFIPLPVDKPPTIIDFPEAEIKNLKLPPVFQIKTSDPDFSKLYEFPPVAKTQIKPIYPSFALEMGISDKVIILVFIDRDGIVQKAELLDKNDPYGFGAAAIAAVIKTEFEPAIMGWTKVPIRMKMPFTFKIR